MLPLDDDMVIHVGPANGGQVETDKLEAFILPRRTMVILKPGTWHGAPYPINNDGIANMTNGRVTTQGDSCGFWPGAKP